MTITEAQRAVLAAGLAWLYDTVQPADAITSHHGYCTAADGRRLRFAPRGSYPGGPVIVIDVAQPHYDGPQHNRVLTNPLGGHTEMLAWCGVLGELGHDCSTWWNGDGETGSVQLTQLAHPTLRHAEDNYRQGCPDHPGPLCSWDGCRWFPDREARLVMPAWPAVKEPA